MDKRTPARILVLMASVGFALVVYTFAVWPMPAPSVAGPTTPLKTWTTTGLALYAQGTAVNVTVHVQNEGTVEANLSLTSCNAFGFRVEDLQGTPYFDSSTDRACPAVVRVLRLAPGATANETFSWDQTTSTGMPVPRARWYRVVPFVKIPSVTVVESDAALIYLAA